MHMHHRAKSTTAIREKKIIAVKELRDKPKSKLSTMLAVSKICRQCEQECEDSEECVYVKVQSRNTFLVVPDLLPQKHV